MTEQVVELYTDGDMAAMGRKITGWTAVLAVVGLAALGACIAMAALTTTANAMRMEMYAEITSTLAGWFVIYVGIFVVSACRRERRHARMLREEERERTEGVVTVTGERFRIHKSIAVRRVEVRRGDEVKRLLVTENRARALAEADPAAVYTVHGYVAAWEKKS